MSDPKLTEAVRIVREQITPGLRQLESSIPEDALETVLAALEQAQGDLVNWRGKWNATLDREARLLERETKLERERDEALTRLSHADAQIRQLGADSLTSLRERDEARAEVERLQAVEVGNHSTPDECPLWYDGCNCTIEAMVHNFDRAEQAERERDEARAELQKCSDTAVVWRDKAKRAQIVLRKAGEWVAAVDPKLPMPGIGDSQQEVLDMIESALAPAQPEERTEIVQRAIRAARQGYAPTDALGDARAARAEEEQP